MTPPDGISEVDVDEAKQRVDAGALLLDVRTSDEWDEGRAAEAISIPMSELDARQEEIPTDRPIMVVCRTGARSARVTAALVGAGYDATNVAGGLAAWEAAGYGVVADGGQPGTVA